MKGVVKEQVLGALRQRPSNFDQFCVEWNKLTYAIITKQWQDEQRTRDDWKLQARPIRFRHDLLFRTQIFEFILHFPVPIHLTPVYVPPVLTPAPYTCRQTACPDLPPWKLMHYIRHPAIHTVCHDFKGTNVPFFGCVNCD